MGEIKNWPQFNGMSPYSCWFSSNTEEFAFVPLKGPCAAHADGKFDCYIGNCGCEEFKFVRRSAEQVAEIRALQRQNGDDAIVRKAAKILEDRGLKNELLSSV